MRFKGPSLKTTRRLFPAIACVSRSEQLPPMSAGQQHESVNVDHCCGSELDLFYAQLEPVVSASELTTSGPNTFHLIVS